MEARPSCASLVIFSASAPFSIATVVCTTYISCGHKQRDGPVPKARVDKADWRHRTAWPRARRSGPDKSVLTLPTPLSPKATRIMSTFEWDSDTPNQNRSVVMNLTTEQREQAAAELKRFGADLQLSDDQKQRL